MSDEPEIEYLAERIIVRYEIRKDRRRLKENIKTALRYYGGRRELLGKTKYHQKEAIKKQNVISNKFVVFYENLGDYRKRYLQISASQLAKGTRHKASLLLAVENGYLHRYEEIQRELAEVYKLSLEEYKALIIKKIDSKIKYQQIRQT